MPEAYKYSSETGHQDTKSKEYQQNAANQAGDRAHCFEQLIIYVKRIVIALKDTARPKEPRVR